MLLLDTIAALAKLMGRISFSGPPVARSLNFWDADDTDVTIAEDNSMKGKIIENKEGNRSQGKEGQGFQERR